MALLDKLRNGGLPAHEFTDTLILVAETVAEGLPAPSWGKTRADIVDFWGLEASDAAQLDALAAHYAGLTGDVSHKNEKRTFADRLERGIRLLTLSRPDGAGGSEFFWTPAQAQAYLLDQG